MKSFKEYKHYLVALMAVTMFSIVAPTPAKAGPEGDNCGYFVRLYDDWGNFIGYIDKYSGQIFLNKPAVVGGGSAGVTCATVGMGLGEACLCGVLAVGVPVLALGCAAAATPDQLKGAICPELYTPSKTSYRKD